MHGGMHISRNSQIHSIGLLICSRALSDPAVQSYELRIQQSGYSQILIGNESCRDRTKNTVLHHWATQSGKSLNRTGSSTDTAV
jgi:hypothetical protein